MEAPTPPITDPGPLPPFWTGGPPEVDPDDVRPTVEDVARLSRTRTTDGYGNEGPTFTDDTRPTASEVEGLVDDAIDMVLGRLPSHMDECWHPAISRLVAIRAAAVIEVSYFREQALGAGAVSWSFQFTNELQALEQLIPRATHIA